MANKKPKSKITYSQRTIDNDLGHGISPKKIVKKNGKTTVTYSRITRTKYHGNVPSKVRKIYDDKGNFIKGTNRITTDHGAINSVDEKTGVTKRLKTGEKYKDINIKETKTKNKMANPKDKTNKKSSSNSGIKPVTGKIQPVTGKIEPVNYRPSSSKSSSQKPSSNKSASNSKTKQAPKKEKGFVDKANDFIDWAFRDAANKKVGEVNKSVQSKLDSTRKKVGDVNKKVQKDLDPYRKKAADLNKSVQKKLDPVRDALYGKDKKTKTPEKKVTPPISKAPVNKTPAKKDTTPKKESFNLDAEVKKTMSGAYGSGSARKEALGSNYSKVQAEINKRAAASKPKVSAPKTEEKPVAKPELIKMEIKRPGKIESTGPKELQGVTPPKSAVDVDKSIDAAMDAIGKSKIMRKGGSVKSKTINKMKTKMKKYQNGGMAAIPKAGKKNLTPSTGTATDNLSASMAKRNTAAPNKKAMDSAKANMKKGGATKMQSGGTSGGYPQSVSSTAADKAMATPPKSSVKEEAAIPSAKKMKTGGMVNPNAKLQASKKAGSKGVMHSLSAKAVVQKKAKGRSGGTSKAPKTATPKAKYGMIMRKK